jgi:hypothetical protein
MSAHINELIEPKLGKSSPVGKVEKGKTDVESSAKRIRQAVYDIRYRARREGVKLDQAFNQYMAHTNMSGTERTAVKEKLGLIASQTSVGEEYIGEEGAEHKKFKVRVTDKQSGKTYVRYATRQKISQLRKNPNISSVEMTQYGEPYEGEKRKGEATASVASGKGLAKRDYDGDGKIESGSKEHAGVVHNAIQRKKGGIPNGQDTRKNIRKESFSNWRSDLTEVVDKVEDSNKVKEKSVDNYKNKTIVINPEIKEGIQILEMVEVNEEYLVEEINISTEYFFSSGLNEDGLEIVIEELGLEKFVDFISYISEDYELTEARAARRRKPTKSVEQIKAEIEARESSKKKPKSPVAKKVTVDKGQKAVEKAKETQSSKKPVRDAIARGVFRAVDAYKAGMQRHRAATATASKAAKVAAKGASEFGKGVASGIKTTGKVAKAVHSVLKNSYEYEENDIQEKAPPGKKYERMIKHIKKRYSKDGLTDKEKAIAYATAWKAYNEETEIDEGQLLPGESYMDYAKRMRHGKKDDRMTVNVADKKGNTRAYQNYMKGDKRYKSGVGVDEAISQISGRETTPPSGTTAKQDDIERKQMLANKQKMMQKQMMLQRQQFQLQKQGKLPMGRAAEEVEYVDEKTKYAKQTGINYRKQKPQPKGGTAKGDVAFQSVTRMIRGMQGRPSGQRPKVKGQKPPEAGKYGSERESPAQTVAKRRAAAQRAQDMMHSRFD